MRGSTRPEVLDQMHDNDASLAAELQGPAGRCHNRITLDWDNA
ncbi:hypothetical protein [Phytohabitans aurantiacus]|jgi:hypothetical protein|uniref:OmpA-like domain-containing protein n=1 Tax=Phytohabitans aurantiacus TaxID=3016789 RepID=A0ABQ5R602_9ACTN|nr:hypothetical protein [Phytohabitans aurantiacus]GLI01302.1 hypothetical protein Pa4123_65780 [Phytohabitans aurantiacus]